jgi:hypothetical protein
MSETSIPIKAHLEIVKSLDERIDVLETREAANTDEGWVETDWESFQENEWGLIEDGKTIVKILIGNGGILVGTLIYIYVRENGAHYAEIVPKGWSDGVQLRVASRYIDSNTLQETFTADKGVKVYRLADPEHATIRPDEF